MRSCCLEHKCHRYSLDLIFKHLGCETRLPQRKRRAGNFPQCDSLLFSRHGACAQNQESERERENKTEWGGGWDKEQEVVRKRRRGGKVQWTERIQKMKIKWKGLYRRTKETQKQNRNWDWGRAKKTENILRADKTCFVVYLKRHLLSVISQEKLDNNTTSLLYLRTVCD